MFMTFEQVPPPEHPAIRAARTIKQMHLDTIKMMDDGFVFTKKLENGDLQDVNDQMRSACLQQIDYCDKIMFTADQLPPEMLRPIELLLNDAKVTIGKALEEAVEETKNASLPEIGNYEHKTD